MGIDISKISKTDRRILARGFLEILERDYENPAIRARFEKWKKEQNKKNKKGANYG